MDITACAILSPQLPVVHVRLRLVYCIVIRRTTTCSVQKASRDFVPDYTGDVRSDEST
jgi:hypothetical protein